MEALDESEVDNGDAEVASHEQQDATTFRNMEISTKTDDDDDENHGSKHRPGQGGMCRDLLLSLVAVAFVATATFFIVLRLSEDQLGPEQPAAAANSDDAPVDNHQLNDTYWTYKIRGQPLSPQQRKELEEEYGSWSWPVESPLRHSSEGTLLHDVYAMYPNRDIPWDCLPEDAWHTDPAYMESFLKESKDLVMRAMEAILAEYGHGRKDEPEQTFQARSQALFDITMIADEDLWELQGKAFPGKNAGGYTTTTSWDGLKRRLLHALITEDSFVFAMGGDSAAAGHGNHFTQSYTLQVAWILQPIFARLGIKHESRNFGNGGMGTSQNGIAASHMYGPDVDILMWDSAMTESGDGFPDMMARQAVLGGIKVPLLWNFPLGVAKNLTRYAGCDVGSPGNGMANIPETVAITDLENTPWAARYMKCSNEIDRDVCKSQTYNTTCWIERPDYSPETTQSLAVAGAASWHPGFRFHQLRGRVITFTILKALHEVLTEWEGMQDFVMPDEAWHMTNYYQTMREKVRAMEGDDSPCYKLEFYGLEKICKLPMKARSEWSPRPYPDQSSLRSIMPPEQLEYFDPPLDVAYQPPDVLNPRLHPPPGAVDVLNIVENGSPFLPILNTNYHEFYDNAFNPTESLSQEVGKGHMLFHPSGICDGSSRSFCNRDRDIDCLLSGHDDARSGIMSGSKSGWLLFNVPKVEHGFILLKLETWHLKSELDQTLTDEENYHRRQLNEHRNGHDIVRRQVRQNAEPFCDDFRFEISINGIVESLNKTEFIGDEVEGYTPEGSDARRKRLARIVEIVKLLDDANITGDVQVGIRIKGCKEFKYSHLYWA